MRDKLAQLRLDTTQIGLNWQAGLDDKLLHLADLLQERSQHTNLVGDPSPTGLCEHVLEAFCVGALAQTVLGHDPDKIADIGAGAGLEGIALALMWPNTQVVAVEQRRLRYEFIQLVQRELQLQNLEVKGMSLFSAQLPADFELATARAVWPEHQWLPRARAIVRAGGLIALHGRAPASDWADVTAALDVSGARGHAVAVVRV